MLSGSMKGTISMTITSNISDEKKMVPTFKLRMLPIIEKIFLMIEKSIDNMRKKIGADYLIFNDLQPIINELRQMNPIINDFEVSMFK